MSIAAAPRSGSVVAALRGAVVERGAFRLGPVDVALGWADRVVITGANGSGNTILHLRHTYWVVRDHAD
jgi:hypothetical protein